MARISDLDHWEVLLRKECFTLVTQVIVGSVRAFVSDTNDGSRVAPIAGDVWMDCLALLLSLLLKMLDQKLLVLLCAVLVDLSCQNLAKILKELVVKLASGIALLARKALLVDHLAITAEAVWKVLTSNVVFDGVEILRPQNHAADFFFVSNGVLLASL